MSPFGSSNMTLGGPRDVVAQLLMQQIADEGQPPVMAGDGMVPRRAAPAPPVDVNRVQEMADAIYNRIAPGMGVGQGAGLRSAMELGPDMSDPATQERALSAAMEARNQRYGFSGYNPGDSFAYRNIGGRNYIVAPPRETPNYDVLEKVDNGTYYGPQSDLTAADRELIEKHTRAMAAVRQGRQRRAGRRPDLLAVANRLDRRAERDAEIKAERTARREGRKDRQARVVANAQIRKAGRKARQGDMIGAIASLPDNMKNDPVALSMLNPQLGQVAQQQQQMKLREALNQADIDLKRAQAGAYKLTETDRAYMAVLNNPNAPPEMMEGAMDHFASKAAARGAGGAAGGAVPSGAPNFAKRREERQNQALLSAQLADPKATPDQLLEIIMDRSGGDVTKARQMMKNTPQLTRKKLIELQYARDPSQWSWLARGWHAGHFPNEPTYGFWRGMGTAETPDETANREAELRFINKLLR